MPHAIAVSAPKTVGLSAHLFHVVDNRQIPHARASVAVGPVRNKRLTRGSARRLARAAGWRGRAGAGPRGRAAAGRCCRGSALPGTAGTRPGPQRGGPPSEGPRFGSSHRTEASFLPPRGLRPCRPARPWPWPEAAALFVAAWTYASGSGCGPFPRLHARAGSGRCRGVDRRRDPACHGAHELPVADVEAFAPAGEP
jgi:hypothetical protein